MSEPVAWRAACESRMRDGQSASLHLLVRLRFLLMVNGMQKQAEGEVLRLERGNPLNVDSITGDSGENNDARAWVWESYVCQ
jgi:hypothetical protein